MTTRALYKLQCICDDPRYEGFAFTGNPSIRGKSSLRDDFLPDDTVEKGRSWTVTRMAHLWTPQRVIGRVRPFNDYPCITFNVPAFSRRAVDALQDLLEPNGELLPLLTSVGEYYAYNVTTVADVLDHERSVIEWHGGSIKHIALSIDHFELYEERLNNLSIFRIVEQTVSTYVTNRFAERVRELKLEGFDFIRVWPLPKGVDWMTPWNYPELRDPLTLPPEPDIRPIKGNTVVIRLQLSRERATSAEKERIASIEDELDAMLVNPRKNAVYYGSLEGDDYVAGECRLFFSCPDADRLARKLKPWLKKLVWAGEKWLLKRYGEYVDVSATEEYVDLR